MSVPSPEWPLLPHKGWTHSRHQISTLAGSTLKCIVCLLSVHYSSWGHIYRVWCWAAVVTTEHKAANTHSSHYHYTISQGNLNPQSLFITQHRIRPRIALDRQEIESFIPYHFLSSGKAVHAVRQYPGLQCIRSSPLPAFHKTKVHNEYMSPTSPLNYTTKYSTSVSSYTLCCQGDIACLHLQKL